jgi:hypothetical protein
MAKIVVIVLLLLLPTFWFPKAGPGSSSHFDSALCRVPVAAANVGWKVADVLCCCKTHTGGECCVRAAQCGSKPPGCFCASPSVPGVRQRRSFDERGTGARWTSTCQGHLV